MRRRTGRGVFGWLLHLFPSEFRREFGDEMAADFADQRDDARAAGKGRVARLWWRTLVDVGRRVPVEHLLVVRRDVGYAARMLRRRPAFALVVTLTLAIGIGVNTAVFSVVSGILLRALPLPDGDRVVRLTTIELNEPAAFHDVSAPDFLDWQAQARTLDALATSSLALPGTFIADNGEPDTVSGLVVTARFFDVVGAAPALGRAFTPDEYQSGSILNRFERGPSVAIVSDGMWRNRFGARPDIVGTTFQVGERRLEVVGVMPAGLDLRGVTNFAAAEYWLPGRVATDGPMGSRRNRGTTAIGRLVPGVTLAQAQAEFDTIAATLAATYADDAGWAVKVVDPLEPLVRPVRAQVWLLGAAALCVLLIAAANVTNLLLAQSEGRRLELATRVALGASRAQVVRQLVTEGLVLCGVGGVAGVVLAHLAVPALVVLAPDTVPRLDQIVVDRRSLAFAVAATVAVGVACGLTAGLAVTRRRVDLVIRSGRQDVRRGGVRVRQVLTVAQVSLALVLVVAAGLLVRTVQALGAVDLGFDPQNVIGVSASPDRATIGGLGGMSQFNAALIEQVRSLHGVVSAGTGPTPFSLATGTRVSAAPDEDGEAMEVDPVTPGYLRALRMRLVRGRLFEETDTANDAAIALVSESAARHFWPGGDPVGRLLYMNGERSTVVGIVADVRRSGLDGGFLPIVYVLQAQSRRLAISRLFIRTAGDPEAIIPAVRVALRRLDPKAPLGGVQTLEALVDSEIAPRRFLLRLIGWFSALAVVLAMLGVYGVLAESVARRVPEIGVRMALGAHRGAVAGLVLSQGLWLVGAGVLIGAIAAYASRGVMSSVVFGVPTSDAFTFAAASAGVIIAALVACLIPARRAASVDPVVALRHD